jgi:peptidoglycan LD-endopeptidase CwlK
MKTIRELQEFVGVTSDGAWGPKSQAALDSIIHPALVAPPVVADTGEKVDDRSERAISTLHDRVKPLARQLVRLAAQSGITIKVTSGTRTYAEQDALFAQGGVTKARGGQSNHNFGLAFDVTMFGAGGPIYESPKYKDIGQLGKSIGLSWGGDWTSIVDEPHFELRPQWASNMSEGAMIGELRRRHDNNIDPFA